MESGFNFNGLCFMVCSACFLLQLRVTCPGVVPLIEGSPPISTINRENAPRTCVCRQVDGGVVSTEVFFVPLSSRIRTERDAEKRGAERATCQNGGMAGHSTCCTFES